MGSINLSNCTSYYSSSGKSCNHRERETELKSRKDKA